MQNRNITLFGFMGTGKSAVGQILAKQLDRTFVDCDAIIEEREGMSIPELFESRGEPYFRAREADVAREVSERQGLVISAGGGMVLDPANVEALAGSGYAVCLRADADEILRRVGHNTHRPLLTAPDRHERIEALLAERESRYASIPIQVDTTGLSVADVARRVLEAIGN